MSAAEEDELAAGAEPATTEASSVGSPAPDALVGALFHQKYRILRRIGSGGFGAVYEARDERGAGNRVAIKVLRPDVLELGAGLLQAFRNEARRITRLNHPHVVGWKVFDETGDGTLYLVMELVEGEELDRLLAREGRLAPKRAAAMLLQMLDALRAAHHLSENEAILHLDLKPRNVFVIPAREGREETVKLIDFGIGQFVGGEEEESDGLIAEPSQDLAAEAEGFHPATISFRRRAAVPLDPPGPAPAVAPRAGRKTTVRRSLACTPEYASPEQCAHVIGREDIVPLDGRSDLYSLGVMAFQMLTGRFPFGRPIVRSDVLRMHLEDAPERVGAQGIRIPKNLARFVDRCLETDREHRFRDANEAYAVLHRIVRPPVWTTVAKVVVPFVLVVGVGIAVLWSRFARPRPTAGLVAAGADGGTIDLASETLYVGPARESADLSATLPDGEKVVFPNAPCRLVRSSDGVVLPGWSASCTTNGVVRVEAVGRPSGRVEERAVLRVDGSAVDFKDFALVWLGAESSSIDAVEFAGQDAAKLGSRAVDPIGLDADVWIAGEGRKDLAAVEVQAGTGGARSLLPMNDLGARLLYRISLQDLGLPDGPTTLTIRARDRAQRILERSIPLRVLSSPLAIHEVKLLDSSQGGGREDFPECNRLPERYLLTPRTKPTLRVAANRPASIRWSVVVDGRPSSLTGIGSVEGTLFADLAGLADLAGGGAYSGSIRVEAVDEETVLHAPGSSSRGAALPRDVAFSFGNQEARFSALIVDRDGVRRALPENTVLWTNHPDARMVVTRESTVAMKIVLGVSRAGSPTPGEAIEDLGLRNVLQQEVEIPLRLAGDGIYEVSAAAFQFDSQASRSGDKPDLERKYRIGVDTHAPALAIAGFDRGTVIAPSRPVPPAIQIKLGPSVQPTDLGSGAASSTASPVDVAWTLVRAGSDSPTLSGDVGRDVSEPGDLSFAFPSSFTGPTSVEDGDWRFSLTAKDRAGNESRLEPVDFVVAQSGPALSLERPALPGTWQPTARGDWLIQVRARDPNGVGAVECGVFKEREGAQSLPITLTQDTGSPAGDQVLTGAVHFSNAWSSTQAWLKISARDSLGTPSKDEWFAASLPEIDPPRPERVEAVLSSGQAESMRLVRGNRGSSYLFGGRGDELENNSFVQAGIDPFNPALQFTRPLSWQVEFKPDEIADFYLDEREISVGQFLQFLRAGNDGFGNAALRPAGSAPVDRTRAEKLEERLRGQAPELPVADITWEEASAYARWVGKRLPTWIEWEYAARGGVDYRPYPCCGGGGRIADLAGANVASTGSNAEARPRARGEGTDRTPGTQLLDMTGNVAEWTESPDLTDGRATEDLARHAGKHRDELLHPRTTCGFAACRTFWSAGGSFQSPRFDFTVAESLPRDANRPWIGFRCAASISDVRSGMELGHFREASP